MNEYIRKRTAQKLEEAKKVEKQYFSSEEDYPVSSESQQDLGDQERRRLQGEIDRLNQDKEAARREVIELTKKVNEANKDFFIFRCVSITHLKVQV